MPFDLKLFDTGHRGMNYNINWKSEESQRFLKYGFALFCFDSNFKWFNFMSIIWVILIWLHDEYNDINQKNCVKLLQNITWISNFKKWKSTEISLRTKQKTNLVEKMTIYVIWTNHLAESSVWPQTA